MQPALSILPASVRPQGAAVSRATGSRRRAKQRAVSGPPRIDHIHCLAGKLAKNTEPCSTLLTPNNRDELPKRDCPAGGCLS